MPNMLASAQTRRPLAAGGDGAPALGRTPATASSSPTSAIPTTELDDRVEEDLRGGGTSATGAHTHTEDHGFVTELSWAHPDCFGSKKHYTMEPFQSGKLHVDSRHPASGFRCRPPARPRQGRAAGGDRPHRIHRGGVPRI